MISYNYLILILILILLIFNSDIYESYIVLKCNSKNIPKDMIKYQKKCKTNNYGFIPRSLYPDLVKLVNNHSDELRNDFNNKDGLKIFKYIKPEGECRYFHLIKDGKKLNHSNKFPTIMKLIESIPNLRDASLSCLNPNTQTNLHTTLNPSRNQTRNPTRNSRLSSSRQAVS